MKKLLLASFYILIATNTYVVANNQSQLTSSKKRKKKKKKSFQEVLKNNKGSVGVGIGVIGGALLLGGLSHNGFFDSKKSKKLPQSDELLSTLKESESTQPKKSSSTLKENKSNQSNDLKKKKKLSHGSKSKKLKKQRESYNVDFTKQGESLRKKINFKSEIPTIRKIEWGALEYQKPSQGKIKNFTKKEDPSDKKTKADEIFWKEGTEHWNWKESDTRHIPGYTKEGINYIIDKTPNQEFTHLILSTGWEDKLQVNNEYRPNINENSFKEILQNKLGKDKKIRILQKLESPDKLEQKDNEIVVLILNTSDAVQAYNYLIQDDKNIVIAAIHATC